ncbi:hypothetical protein CMUS01_12166 [Colletotrichum musicola]|uniref:Uncharacterized protein n=1 Tax=Colletotrichum musicola TaxID=2175873 RepID=A0A8H6JQ95_9PEZI|nr:hypothetical protein CMUS01_12166 [Colletotrichum musicola]
MRSQPSRHQYGPGLGAVTALSSSKKLQDRRIYGRLSLSLPQPLAVISSLKDSQYEILDSAERVAGTVDTDWEIKHQPPKARGVKIEVKGPTGGFADLLQLRLSSVQQQLDAITEALKKLADNGSALNLNFTRFGYSRAQTEWDDRNTVQTINLCKRPVIEQHFHKGLLQRASEETSVMGFELFFYLLYADDVAQRVAIIFVFACLLGIATNMIQRVSEEAEHNTYAMKLWRLAACLAMFFLLLAREHLNSFELMATTPGLVVWVLLLEIWGNSCKSDSFWAQGRRTGYSARFSMKELLNVTKSDEEVNVLGLKNNEKTAADGTAETSAGVIQGYLKVRSVACYDIWGTSGQPVERSNVLFTKSSRPTAPFPTIETFLVKRVLSKFSRPCMSHNSPHGDNW